MITSLKQMISAIQMCTGDSCVIDIMTNTKIPVRDLEQYYTWNEEHYTRIQLAKTDNFEVLLVCWEKGQQSPIHEFKTQEAWLHPVIGQLREEKFMLSPKGQGLLRLSSVQLGQNDYSYMKTAGIHRYTNVYGSRSVCLVVFSPKVEKLKIYDEETGKFVYTDVWYDKVYHLDEEEDYDLPKIDQDLDDPDKVNLWY